MGPRSFLPVQLPIALSGYLMEPCGIQVVPFVYLPIALSSYQVAVSGIQVVPPVPPSGHSEAPRSFPVVSK